MNYYYKAIGELITTGHWITDSVSKELREFGIYEPQYNVLRILRAAGGKPVMVNNILEGMVQRSSNVTRIVDKLILKGLVERNLSKSDRRKMDVKITKKGLNLLEKLDERVHAFHEPYLKKLTRDEAIQLKNLIRKLRGNESVKDVKSNSKKRTVKQ